MRPLAAGGRPIARMDYEPPANSSHLNTTGYQFRREFSLTEGAARGTRGHLGPGGRDQCGFVAGIMVLERGQRPGIQGRMTGSEAECRRRGPMPRSAWFPGHVAERRPFADGARWTTSWPASDGVWPGPSALISAAIAG
jgi:hypothetical protein